jgi:hypothetical protein
MFEERDFWADMYTHREPWQRQAGRVRRYILEQLKAADTRERHLQSMVAFCDGRCATLPHHQLVFSVLRDAVEMELVSLK